MDPDRCFFFVPLRAAKVLPLELECFKGLSGAFVELMDKSYPGVVYKSESGPGALEAGPGGSEGS